LVIGLLSVDDVEAAGMLDEDCWPIVMVIGPPPVEDVAATGVLDEDSKPTVMVIGPPLVEDVGAAGVLEVLAVSPTGLEVMGELAELTDKGAEELSGEVALELLGITARASRTFQWS
jgi:hypothetical protein